jgi:hypothetical protein
VPKMASETFVRRIRGGLTVTAKNKSSEFKVHLDARFVKKVASPK